MRRAAKLFRHCVSPGGVRLKDFKLCRGAESLGAGGSSPLATPGFVEPWPLALSLWVLWWVQSPHGLTLLSLP